jgi:ubiquinone/menaquinone biosynthesis C-methylase UbiE
MILDDKLTVAPIEDPDKVLEIGAGTGAWAIEFAADHPLCNVIGTDLSLKQIPDHLLSSTNCEFMIENSETRDWDYEDVFDYIHLRSMSPCFSDIRVIFKKAFESLKPGGWIEMQDVTWSPHAVDDTLSGSSMERWCEMVRGAGVKSGRVVDKVKQCKRLMEEAGFANVTEEVIPCPGGPWAKDPVAKKMGILLSNTLLGLIDSYRRFVLEADMGLMPEEVDDLASKAMDEIKHTKVRWYSNLYASTTMCHICLD